MTETKKQKQYFENFVEVIGKLKTFNVQDKVSEKSGERYKNILIAVETGTGETHQIRKMEMENRTKDGKRVPNDQYKAIETMQEKYVAMDSIPEGNPEGLKPTIVRVTGSLENNMYKSSKTGKLVEATQIRGRYVSEHEATPEEFGAFFTIQTFMLEGARREQDRDGNDLDTVITKMATIDYKEVAHPFVVKANDEYGVAEFLEAECEIGHTYTIGGRIVNKYIVIREERPNPAGVGRPIVDVKRVDDRKMLVESIIPENEENPLKFIDAEIRKKAIANYQAARTEKESEEVKPKKSAANQPKGVQKRPTGVATATATATVGKPQATGMSTMLSDDDLPF